MDIDAKNLTYETITIALPHGKMLSLGPRKTQTITEEDFHSPGFQGLFYARKIGVIPAGKKAPKGKS
jgi:hypothetical protein